MELGKRHGSCLAISKAGYGWTSLVVDLKAVNRVDQAGVYLQALLRECGVRLIASGTAMAEIVRTIEKEWPQNKGESINGKGTERKKK